MKKIYKKAAFFILFSLIISTQTTFSQGIMISDGSETEADLSAVLEIQSTSKGLLIPRLTTVQRDALTSYAKEGLLVYDATLGSFFIYGKTSQGVLGWNDLSTPSGIWQTNNSDVYLSSPYTNVGIGTETPNRKLVIKAQNDNDTLFEILDQYDKPLMIITPTLTKFFFNETTKGVAGGFAVGRYATAKSTNDTALFVVTPDSTRVYSIGSVSKGIAGGFAVGRYATAKGNKKLNNVFFTDADSTRIYAKSTSQAGGFAVGKYNYSKKNGTTGNYMFMVEENYFLGHEAGSALQNSSYTGKYNTFFGYQSGMKDTIGKENVFIGYKSGLNNTGVKDGTDTLGSRNVFLGYEAGYNNTNGAGNVFVGHSAARGDDVGITGSSNVIIGEQAGYQLSEGYSNVFLGKQTGFSNTLGRDNIFIGKEAGYSNIGAGNPGPFNILGDENIFIGNYSGKNNETGYWNVFIGNNAGKDMNSGSRNVFLGDDAGRGIGTGVYNSMYNVIIGDGAGMFITGGHHNVIVGVDAGLRLKTGGDYNIFVGEYSGYSNETGTKNVYLGSNSGENANGSQNIFIGDHAGQNESGSNKLYIENSGSSIPLIYGDFANDSLKINGTLDVAGNINANQSAFCITLTAGEDISLGDVLVVSSTADLQIELTSTVGNERVIGVATKNATVGTLIALAIGGVVQVRINNTVTRGDFLQTSTVAGRVNSSGTTGGQGDFGIALQSGVIGDLIWMVFKKSEVF